MQYKIMFFKRFLLEGNALKAIRQGLDEAKDSQALVAALAPLKALPFSIDPDRPLYKFARFMWAVVVLGAIVELYCYLMLWSQHSHHPSWWSWLLVLAAPALVAGIYFYQARSEKIRRLEEDLWNTKLLLDNDITPQPCSKDAITALKGRFPYFYGSDNDTFISLGQGHYQGSQHSFDYQVIIHRWKSDKHFYYCYALALPFGLAKSLTLTTFTPSGGKWPSYDRWQPASQAFNAKIKATCKEELDAARFLKPMVVERWVKLLDEIKDPNLLIEDNGDLLFLTSDKGLLAPERQGSLKDPASLASHYPLEKLAITLDLVHFLMVHNDNNFDTPLPQASQG
ncbi:hypothetical protein B3C1_18552 [Gallaecimonas xiamenensis 3-C-1]|uniref:DUF3137 domain-containing protein n=2 Tax=Gallaecimonas TaxID=745410 RepID=K2IC93_9GAMM|nr:hypothetical protein B3C1_18552 [Gallaecimonas xiamenensis 3-C-1]